MAYNQFASSAGTGAAASPGAFGPGSPPTSNPKSIAANQGDRAFDPTLMMTSSQAAQQERGIKQAGLVNEPGLR